MLHSDKLSRKRACTSPVKHIPIKQQTLAFRRDMMGRFQPWAMKTYGDSAKTKTVTRKKQSRISKILRGEESKTPENTKFCSWVKAKGFCIGPPPGHPKEGKGCDQILYVPACTVKDENGKERPVYKKVAIVEDFFDIIYDVHVETEGKHGKHAGQKRTYRAISEKYAFLPREAVTKFLLQCTDCQRRGTVGSDISRSSSQSPQEPRKFDFDFNMPITTTYLKRMRSMGYSDEETLYSEEAGLRGAEGKENNPHPGLIPEDGPLHPDWTGYQALGLKKQGIISDQAKSPILLGRGQNESIPMDDTSSNGAKDEDDDMDDDDSDDKIDTQHYDPERLKAFNMFVRLFVDENLDRIVPISKQPKEKIQAIIDSCNRQFPEFCERARKRIRTYLKSCRRNKRTREQNGMELSRPTPPHLTSIQAEQILAQACENESQNAKRMRMGLDPVSQPMPSVPNNNPSSTEKPPSDKVHVPVPQDRIKTEPAAERVPPATTPSPVPSINSKGDQSPFPPDHFAALNGHSPSPFALYKTNFAQTFHKNNNNNNNSGMGSESFITGLHGSRMSNGSELNFKRGHKPNLSTSEIAAVRQLIIGYRESAAFLLRSADELEQLLISQR